MSAEFLKHLEISEEERRKLASLGAGTPLALLAMRRASREAFDQFLGPDRAERIDAALTALLSDQERSLLVAPLPPARPLGARLDHTLGSLKDPPFDLARRDRLLRELEALRQQPGPTPETLERIRQIEEELASLLGR